MTWQSAVVQDDEEDNPSLAWQALVVPPRNASPSHQECGKCTLYPRPCMRDESFQQGAVPMDGVDLLVSQGTREGKLMY
jgi:hypothetical protein